MPERILLTRDGDVAHVRLNRPEVRNAQTPHTWHALAKVPHLLPSGVRVVVLSATVVVVAAPAAVVSAGAPWYLRMTLLDKPGALAKILSHHVFAPGKVNYATAKSLRPAKIKMLDGEEAILRGQKNRVIIDSTNVIVKNIRSKNLQIHVIDGVMIPPSITAAAAPIRCPGRLCRT